MTPRRFADYLHQELTNGTDRLRFKDAAAHFKMPAALLRLYYADAQKILRRMGVCSILVTETYFELFDTREPKTDAERDVSIALHFRRSAGIRLLTAKGVQNDPLGKRWLELNAMTASGKQGANLDRIVIEWSAKHLTKPQAKSLVGKMVQSGLPEHAAELAKLMGIKPNELEE